MAFRYLFIFAVLFAHQSIVSAQIDWEKIPVVILNDKSHKYDPESAALLFEDRSAGLGFDQIMDSLPKFKINPSGKINLGPSTAAIWCVFRLKNTTNEKWFIEMGESYVDEIDMYAINDSDEVQQIETGLFRKNNPKAVKVNHYLFPLNLSINEEKMFLIRAKSTSVLNLPLVVGTLQTHYEINHKKDFIFGLYFGLILALSIYNFFVFISIKDITYLFYVFYINFLGATVSWLKGYSPEFLNFLPPQVNHGNSNATLSILFLILFTHFFLNIKTMAPQLKKVEIVFFGFNFIGLVINILGFYHIGFYFVMLWVVLFSLPYVLGFGIYAMKKGFRPAGFYILGFSVFALGDFIFMLNENAILPQNFLTHYSLQIGSSIEAMILSFALANKLNSFKLEKEQTQALALASANKFSKELIETQENERKRIAGELHDSVGQSLSLIKNKIALLAKGLDKRNSLSELNDVVSNTIQEVRSISYGLRPFHLDILGLTQSIKSLVEDVAESSDTTFNMTVENIDHLFSKEAEIHIFRIIQECLNNISKHSKATQAIVKITHSDKYVRILIEDNGIGIDNYNGESGLGLRGIRERVNFLNGTIEIDNKEPTGTSIGISIEETNL
ncbi:MAG: 7TM diverse intracellular signaling domain-containing protein [Prolixibacteraceae bacterium]|jgi:signal transduction histidine kinase